jgi:hypothetical protein
MVRRTLARSIAADEAATNERGWAFDLAVFRIAFLGLAVLPFAWRALGWTAAVLPGLSGDVWAPVSFFAWLPADIVHDARLAWWLALANVVCVGLGLAGVRTGATLGAATVLSLYVLGLMENAGKVDHYHHLIWFMALLAVGPSGRFLAVDAIGAARGREDEPAGALTTLRAVWLLLGLIYLGPGLAKLAAAIGDGWASPEHLRLIIGWQRFARTLYQPGFEPTRWIDGLPPVALEAGGVAVIAFEVGFVWLVLIRWARPYLAVAGIAFHLMNGVVLGIWFTFLLPAYVALIDWSALGRRVGLDAGGSAREAASLPVRASRQRTIEVVAAVLIVAEAGVSAGRLLWPAWRGPVWPFDLYPTFASRRSPDATVWEPRIVRSDGRAMRLGPAAWSKAFGSAARSRRVAESIRDERDPARRRERSREVLALLWRHEALAAREAAVAIDVYEVRYAVTNAATPIEETFLDRFDVSEIVRKDGGARTAADVERDQPSGSH